MPRDWFINGCTLVKVKGGDQWQGQVPGIASGGTNVALELGLALGNVRISPAFHREDLKSDDWGKQAAPDVQHSLAHVTISMTLVHYDPDVLSLCVQEGLATGGQTNDNPAGAMLDGTAAGAGTPLGKGLPMFSSGNNLVSLNILSEIGENPWRFRSCFLADSPFAYPLGTKNSEVSLTWTAIPYSPLFVSTSGVVQQYAASGQGNFQELSSSGVVIWDHVLDD